MTKMTTLSTQDMADAFARRDRGFDGRFVVGVRTTGIYCRPSCPARRPKPGNIRFFATAQCAADAGFRPCRRCLPETTARDSQAVAMALQLLQAAPERVPLARLAAHCGYSEGHLQRIFTRATGMSPAAYARANRAARAREALRHEARVVDAIYAAGYASPSRFYDAMKGQQGMTAQAWRNGGEGEVIQWAIAPTSFGPMLIAATSRGVCRIAFGETDADLRHRFARAKVVEAGESLSELLARVVAAVEHPGSDPAIPLDLQGTTFQQRVWAQLRAIPAGETRSYGEIASALGQPGASRAVGGANGANPVAVLVPCHRVVAADGGIGGYAWGEPIKRALLAREEAAHPAGARRRDQTKL